MGRGMVMDDYTSIKKYEAELKANKSLKNSDCKTINTALSYLREILNRNRRTVPDLDARVNYICDFIEDSLGIQRPPCHGTNPDDRVA